LEVSRRALRDSINFAKEIGAAMTGLTGIPEYPVYAYQVDMLFDSRKQFNKECIAYANDYFRRNQACSKRNRSEMRYVFSR
jgi:hypothetical protein